MTADAARRLRPSPSTTLPEALEAIDHLTATARDLAARLRDVQG